MNDIDILLYAAMSQSKPVTVTKTKRKAISFERKIQILDRLTAGEGTTSVGKHFGLNEATIRTIKKNEASIRKSVCSGTNVSSNSSSYTRDIVKEKMEKELLIWIEDNAQRRVPVDGNAIKQTAVKLYRQIKDMEQSVSSRLKKKFEFSASTGWMIGFLKRHSLHNVKIKGKDESAAQAFPQEFANFINNGGYPPGHVWNANDQVWNGNASGHSWKAKPKRTYIAASSFKAAKDRAALLFGCNASENRPPLNADLLKEGLELAKKLGNHFVKHDPNEDRAEKFQRELKSLTASYCKLYKELSKTGTQPLITSTSFRKTSETSASAETRPDFSQ